jgi:hypothetical protein
MPLMKAIRGPTETRQNVNQRYKTVSDKKKRDYDNKNNNNNIHDKIVIILIE